MYQPQVGREGWGQLLSVAFGVYSGSIGSLLGLGWEGKEAGVVGLIGRVYLLRPICISPEGEVWTDKTCQDGSFPKPHLHLCPHSSPRETTAGLSPPSGF